MPSSESLNSINIWLKKCIDSGYLFSRLEDYISNLVFAVPLPLRQYPTVLKLYLPNEGLEKDQVLMFQQPGLEELPYANHDTI